MHLAIVNNFFFLSAMTDIDAPIRPPEPIVITVLRAANLVRQSIGCILLDYLLVVDARKKLYIIHYYNYNVVHQHSMKVCYTCNY